MATKGTQKPDNAGNFANDREKASDAGKKGGQASGGKASGGNNMPKGPAKKSGGGGGRNA